MVYPPRHENGGIFDRGEEAQKKAPSKNEEAFILLTQKTPVAERSPTI
jgi:hypothetical protein